MVYATEPVQKAALLKKGSPESNKYFSFGEEEGIISSSSYRSEDEKDKIFNHNIAYFNRRYKG
jgi:hypothetical protein